MSFFTFDGRIGRGDWWLLNIALTVLGLIGVFVAAAVAPGLVVIVYLAVVVSSWSIGARRCHDLGWSGAMLMLNFVPFVGWLFLFVALGFVPGQAGVNRYGYPPGYVAANYYDYPPNVADRRMVNVDASPPPYLRSGFQAERVHPSLREANDRAWQSGSWDQ